ncbi:hypothetical protein H7Y63_00925 [Polaromonas sp.]|nr:hypothetical protein [Candidatus Saccharibacteria bacterium]
MRQAIKHKNSKFAALFAACALLLVMIMGVNSPVVSAAEPIPAGCPNTEIQGPGTVDCSKIPLGCPGSTLQGPVASPPSNCPYGAPSTPTPAATTTNSPSGTKSGPHCGFASNDEKTNQAVYTSFEIGCQGRGNPIMDAAFALIRFLSIGVGLIIVGSLTYAGIQYTAARGDPKAAGEAKERIKSNVVAFFIYVLSSALLNFVVPQGFFK